MSKQIELLACPFCGNRDVAVCTINSSGDMSMIVDGVESNVKHIHRFGHYIGCDVCGANNMRQPMGCRTQQEAIMLWNTRRLNQDTSADGIEFCGKCGHQKTSIF